ncbi:MAG: hypothetical protein BWX77_00701 [Bacteroidetes bacterium ADurb.Bin090]|nr:MAG: hypothetical protein BWX77_00701 [Bacteroidetes bacterium ADurb.Bin090]
MLGQLFAFPDGVQQESTVLTQTFGDIVKVQISLHMTSYKIGRIHQIGRTYGGIAKTQVRTGKTAGLFGVVRKISLTIFIGIVSDNLDGILIGSYRTVSAQAIEFGFVNAFAAQCNFFLLRQRSERNVVNYTYGKLVAGFG